MKPSSILSIMSIIIILLLIWYTIIPQIREIRKDPFLLLLDYRAQGLESIKLYIKNFQIRNNTLIITICIENPSSIDLVIRYFNLTILTNSHEKYLKIIRGSELFHKSTKLINISFKNRKIIERLEQGNSVKMRGVISLQLSKLNMTMRMELNSLINPKS